MEGQKQLARFCTTTTLHPEVFGPTATLGLGTGLVSPRGDAGKGVGAQPRALAGVGGVASVLPAAHLRICCVLRQTAGEGLCIMGQTLVSAQSHHSESPYWVPTMLRPHKSSSAKPTELEGLGPYNRGSNLEVAVPPTLALMVWRVGEF